MTKKVRSEANYKMWRMELLRRMILLTPDPPKYCKAEVSHKNNRHNRKISRLEIALAEVDFADFRRRCPQGWHPDKISGGYPLGRCGLAGEYPNDPDAVCLIPNKAANRGSVGNKAKGSVRGTSRRRSSRR